MARLCLRLMRVVDCSVHSGVRRHEEARENKEAFFRREICTCPWARALIGTSLYASHASREPRGAQRHASTASNYQTRNLVARDVRLRRRYDVVTSRDVMLFGNPRAGARVSALPPRRPARPRAICRRTAGTDAPQVLALARIVFVGAASARALLQARGFRPGRQRRDGAECCVRLFMVGRRASAAPRAVPSLGRRGAAWARASAFRTRAVVGSPFSAV